MNNTQTVIENLYTNSANNVNHIMLGYKHINNQPTNIISIIYGVNKKRPLNELSPSEIIPPSLNIDGITYPTDVKEYVSNIKMLTCYTNYNTDPEILRLQGNPSLLAPLKGGQEIIQFPTEWAVSSNGYGITAGTLGLICVDNEDNRIVGLTNAHVLCKDLLQNAERSSFQKSNTYNLYESITWPLDGKLYPPGAICRTGTNLVQASTYIKRYSPYSKNNINYIDICLIGFNSALINLVSASSYQIHQPTTVGQTLGYLPFATTSEINNLLTTPFVRVYSTGRSTGPKGWGDTASCQLIISGVSLSTTVLDGDGLEYDFADLIQFQYADGSNFPSAPGDSGSAVLASINGVVKVIGLLFAGSGGTFDSPEPGIHYAYVCRIDRIASSMNVKSWDSGYIMNNTTPTATIKTAPYSDNSANNESAIVNGQKYWNIGLTKNTGYDTL